MQKALAMAILSVVGMLLAPGFGSADDAPTGTPSAFLAESVYEFQPVVEGSEVVHGFTIENRGDAPLEIIDIKSG